MYCKAKHGLLFSESSIGSALGAWLVCMISLIEETKKSCSSSQMHVVVAQRRSKRISMSRNGNNDDDGDDTLASQIFPYVHFSLPSSPHMPAVDISDISTR